MPRSVPLIVLAVWIAIQGGIVRCVAQTRHTGEEISQDQSRDREGAVSRPATQPINPDADVPPDQDYEQMLREAYELIDDNDLTAALRALQHVVSKAPAEALPALEAQTLQTRGQPLDDLLAQVRMRRALRPDGERLFDMRSATRYEARALGQRLERLAKGLREHEYAGHTLADWPALRDEYTQLTPDARDMVRDARLLAAVISARLRFDPRLDDNRKARTKLTHERLALTRFSAGVAKMTGFTALGSPDDADDPTLAVARRLAEEATTQPATQLTFPRASDPFNDNPEPGDDSPPKREDPE